MEKVRNALSLAHWNNAVNATEENRELMIAKAIKYKEFNAQLGKAAFQGFNINLIQDPKIKKEMDIVQKSRSGSTSKERGKKSRAAARMASIHTHLRFCPKKAGCNESETISMSHVLHDFMRMKNATTRKNLWVSYHDSLSPEFKNFFYECAKLDNTEAQHVGYSSLSDKLLYEYTRDQPDFREHLESLWLEILPFFEDIHAYLRYQLKKWYGPDLIHLNDSIPAHLQGTMHSSGFFALQYLALPKKNITKKPDISRTMRARNWTQTHFFEAAEGFFTSIGFPSLPRTFWAQSLLERPMDGRKVKCHPTAHDIKPGDNRILMCTDLTESDFMTAHHEMGHIYYFMAYENQSVWFRDGANPGFHEAVGDAIFLSAQHDKYLKHLKLLPQDFHSSEDQKLNEMMRRAVMYVGHLPFAYILDRWRWDIFDGKINKSVANDRWWDLVYKYQGTHRPTRSTMDNFDPGLVFHVANEIPYIRYFVSFALQYQIHEALCKEAGFEKTSDCTIYNNKKAGKKLWEMMRLGKTKPWPKVLKQLTGTDQISFQPLNRYFAPVRDWLRKENTRLGLCIGWGAEWPTKAMLQGPRC